MCLASAKLLLLRVSNPGLSHYPLNLTARRFNELEGACLCHAITYLYRVGEAEREANRGVPLCGATSSTKSTEETAERLTSSSNPARAG
jgi:hypothetical protein